MVRGFHMLAGYCFVIIVMSLISMGQASAESESSCTPLPYALNRADEDYEYLRDPACRIDFWDPIKYIPLNASGRWYLSLGGEARERYEYYSNPNWGAGPPGSGYLLQRYFLHADLQVGEHLRLFTQLQSSLENGRTGGPRPQIDEDQLDLHQAFLDVKFDLGSFGSLLFRPGRQELFYGSQRLIGVREGPNVRQSFDGFRAVFRKGDIQVDGFATRPVNDQRYVFDDKTNFDQALWGVYSVFPLPIIPKGNGDLYYIGYHNAQQTYNQGTGNETRHSVGMRFWRVAPPLDYNFEFVYQWGTFRRHLGFASLGREDISAWTIASDTGYTFHSLPFRPRLGMRANVTSGDRNPKSPDLQTFNPLFPKGGYFSEANFTGPANHIDLNPSIALHFMDGLTLSVDWDFFWRQSIHDGVYQVPLVLVRSSNNSAARYVGSFAQGQLEWNIDRHISFFAQYAHFFAGEFLKETGPHKDIDYVTTWITYKF